MTTSTLIVAALLASATPTDTNRKGFLNSAWRWNRDPRPATFERADDHLKMTASHAAAASDQTFQRRVDSLETDGAFTVALDAARQEDGSRAGLCSLGEDSAELGVTWLGRTQGRNLYFRQNGGDVVLLASNVPQRVVLRAVWAKDGTARFLYSTDGNAYVDAGVSFKGGRMHDRVGLFNYATGREGGEVFFTPYRETPEWYKNARFGIFCHWGPQCAAESGDWYARFMYYTNSWQGKVHAKKYGNPKDFGFKDLANSWKGENWNPDELCALYRRMGATFILAMANHHDNFDMWDSTYQPWNSKNVGPKRDILKGWSDAARKEGLRFGTSFHASHAWSWMEPSRDFDGLLTKEDGKGTWWEGLDPQDLYWQRCHEANKDYKNAGRIHHQWTWGGGMSKPNDAYRENFRLRAMEAIVKYKPDLIYYDDNVAAFWPVADEGLRIVSDFYAMNPDAVAAGKVLSETQRQWLTWDVERGTPPVPMYPKWQTDTCIGDWHYDRARLKKGYRPARDVIRMLVDIVSKNGNLCLSVPIKSDGTIDELERKVCEDIAAWMAVNRDAIFDSDPYEICGEGPQVQNAPPISSQGFNEHRVKPPSKDDVRYMKARNDKGVYVFELAPDGHAPHCPALETKGMTCVKAFDRKGDFPAVYLYK